MPHNKTVQPFGIPDRQLRFTGLLGKVHASAKRYAISLCRSGYGVSAEDVLQDALVVAWCKFDDLRDEGYFGSWLCGIIRRVFSNHLRKAIRRGRYVQYMEEAERQVDAAERSPPLFQVLLVQQALDRLSLRERKALLLFTLGGLKVEELARLEGCSVEGMKKRLQRTRRRVKEFCNEEEGEKVTVSPQRAMSVVAETLGLLDALRWKEVSGERLN